MLLTFRQRQVERLFLRTCGSNKDMARALGISPNTVKYHMRAIYRAYGVRTRIELLKAGLLEDTNAQANDHR